MKKIYIRPEISVVETCADNLLHEVSAAKIFDNTGKLIDEIVVVEGDMPGDADEEDKRDIGNGGNDGGSSKVYRGYNIWE